MTAIYGVDEVQLLFNGVRVDFDGLDLAALAASGVPGGPGGVVTFTVPMSIAATATAGTTVTLDAAPAVIAVPEPRISAPLGRPLNRAERRAAERRSRRR